MNVESGTAILFGMTCAIIALVLLIAFLTDEVIRLRHSLVAEVDYHYEESMASAMAAVSDVTLAKRLRLLADRYEDSADEVIIMNRIKREQWKPEGPVLPVLWLRYHADLLDPPIPDDGFVRLSGEGS